MIFVQKNTRINLRDSFATGIDVLISRLHALETLPIVSLPYTS
jgi:hypothetical protein